MASGYPLALDTNTIFPTKTTLDGHDLSSDPHSKLHGDIGEAVIQLETRVGIASSADTYSLDYQLRHATSAVHDFAADPGLARYGLSQPTGIERIDTTINAGHYRLTAPATNTDENFRTVFACPHAGIQGNSEVRSTFYASSANFASGMSRFQPGHAHRVTAHKQTWVRHTATSGAASTVTDSGAAWTVNQYGGGDVAYRQEYFVTVVSGTGEGQTRRVVSNTATALTVDTAWTTNPASGARFEIWSYNVRAIVWAKNIYLGLHYLVNCYLFNGNSITQIASVDLSAYLYPSSVYAQFPWYFKSKVEGLTASFAIWKGADAESAYGTSGRSGTATIPAEWTAPGMAGLYGAHLAANDWMEFDNLTVSRI